MDTGRKDTDGAARGYSLWELLKTRDFRLLWGAGTLSAIGDQFDLIAFPWLVLLLTGDALAVGVIIAVGSVPTVFFMLIGLLIAAIEPSVQGPVIVGIPVLANTRLPQGAVAVGIISSAYAASALLGAVPSS
ncbi:MAG: hypothetical protein OXC27_05580 [Caldilineaceae bacterium]|nr:hypothetical protein [Caldilineaceae bacterium]